MRHLPTVTALFLLAMLSAWAQGWQWQNPSPQGNSLRAVDFVDAGSGWAVGELGAIVHTTNGGNSWFNQNSGVISDLTSVVFLDRDHGWAAGGESG